MLRLSRLPIPPNHRARHPPQVVWEWIDAEKFPALLHSIPPRRPLFGPPFKKKSWGFSPFFGMWDRKVVVAGTVSHPTRAREAEGAGEC